MKLDIRKTLLAGTALVAVGGFATGAQAGNSANLVIDGGGAAAVPPAAGETLEIQDNDTTAIWDADDGVGSTTSDVEFQGGGVGNSSVKLEDSTGAGPILIQNIDVVDDANTSTVNIDGTNGAVAVQVSGDITNSDGVGGNDVAVVLTDGGNGATLTFAGTGAQAVAATIDGAGDGQGTVTVTNTGGTVAFADDIGATHDLLAFTVGAGATVTTAGVLDANTVTIAAGGSLTTAGDITGDVALSGAAATLALGDNVGVTGNVDNTSGSDGVGILTSASAVGNTSTITGNVGATNSLASVTLTDAGTFDLQGTVAATTISVTAAGGTLDFGGDVTGNVVFGGTADATSSVELADDADITGNVDNTTGADGVGILSLESAGANTSTISGNVGATNTLAEIGIDGTGTTTFAGTVAADLMDFDAAGTADFNGSSVAIADLDFDDQAGTVIFADGTDFTGDIQDSADGEGTVTFEGSSTVTGSVGTGAATDVATVNFDGGAGDEVTISGGVYAETALAFGGAGTATIEGTSIVGTLDTIASSTLNLNGDMTTTGALTNAGTIEIDNDNTLTAATQVDAAGTFIFEVSNDDPANADADDSSTVTSGLLDVTAGADITSATIEINVAGSSAPILDGQEFQLIEGNTNSLTGGPGNTETAVTDDSFIYDFVIVDGTGANIDSLSSDGTADDSDLFAIASLNSISAASTTGNNSTAASVLLEDLAGSTDTEINLLQGSLAGASTQTEFNERVEATQATVDGGHVVAGLTVASQSLGIASQRLAALRSDETGMAAGGRGQGMKVWAQAFGQMADQDQRDGIDGYEADTYGVAVGLDSANILDNGIVGLAVSYGDTSVDSKNANTTDTEVDSYQVTLYGDYDLDDATYLNGMVGYAWSEVDTTRHNVGGVSGLNANGEFDANQFVVQAELGRDYNYGGNMTLTPNVLAHYTYYSADDYTETGAGGAGLNVDNEDLSIFELGLGVDASWLFENADGSMFEPEIRLGARYDLIGDEVEATTTFVGAPGTAFKTEGFDPAQATFEIGAGVKYYSTENWELTANYDYELKSDYDSHAGFLRAAYKF